MEYVCIYTSLTRLAALHIGNEPSTVKKLTVLFQKHYVAQVMCLIADGAEISFYSSSQFLVYAVPLPDLCSHTWIGCHW